MIFPEFSQFLALARQGNFIPVYQEWVADLETPVIRSVRDNPTIFYWNQ
jgi:hypothetical protein